jgi:hypothetical protein
MVIRGIIESQQQGVPPMNDAIIHKIRSLRAKATNAASTEAEIEAALAAITKLMMKHDIDETDLAESQRTSEARHYETGVHLNETDAIINRCWNGICTLTETKLWRTKERKGAKYSYIGDPVDVEMAIYLHEMIVIHGRRGWYAYRANLSETGQKKNSQSRFDFYSSFGDRINARMKEFAKMRMEQRSSTALVVRKDTLIKEKMDEMGIKLRKSRASQKVARDVNAYYAGVSAADRVNLNRPFRGATEGRIE